MLCKIVRRIGHFLSEITLIWSNEQAEDPARAFFMSEAISEYEGGDKSKGVEGGGMETNHCGIWKRQSPKGSGIDRTFEKYTPQSEILKVGREPTASKIFFGRWPRSLIQNLCR